MRELAQAAPKGSTLWVTGFTGSPDLTDARNWFGGPYNVAIHGAYVDGLGDRNSYYSVAALLPNADGEVRRRKGNFARLLALVADDVPLDAVLGRVSYVLETSPGRTQVGILIDGEDPDAANRDLVDALVTQMAARGMMKADAGGNNAVRYVRLPVGQNQKPRDSGAWAHRLQTWAPDVRLSLDDAAGAFGIDLAQIRDEMGAARAAAGGSGVRLQAQDELLQRLTASILRGEHLHDSINQLAASLVASGTAPGAAVNMLRGMMHASAAPRDERWRARMDDIPRSVSTAQQKYAPPVTIQLLQDEPAAEIAQGVPAASSETPGHLLSVPGALGQAVDWINATSRKPQPLLAVQAALALGSAAMGRRWSTDNDNWPALYLLNVGVSGGGKEHAKHAVETLLEAAGLERLIGVGRFVSESSVVSSLIEKPAQFSVLDEFGKTLQSAAIAQNYADRNTLKALMEVWGRAGGTVRPVAYSTAGLSSRQAEDLAKRMVINPSLTVLAMTTPDTLFAGLTSSAVADGFLNRFITVYADRGRQAARIVQSIEPDAGLIEWLQECAAGAPAGAGNLAALGMPCPHDMKPDPAVLPLDAGARGVFSAMEAALVERMNELDAEGLSEMMTRRTEMAMRLALIVARSSRHAAVTRQDAIWARDYVLHHAEADLSMLRLHLADGPFDQLCKAVSDVVAKAGPKGCTEREINSGCRTWRGANLRMRQDALQVLQTRGEMDLVSIVRRSGAGRPRTAWVAAKFIGKADEANSADKTMTPSSAQ
jgi:hypothetical protein